MSSLLIAKSYTEAPFLHKVVVFPGVITSLLFKLLGFLYAYGSFNSK